DKVHHRDIAACRQSPSNASLLGRPQAGGCLSRRPARALGAAPAMVLLHARAVRAASLLARSHRPCSRRCPRGPGRSGPHRHLCMRQSDDGVRRAASLYRRPRSARGTILRRRFRRIRRVNRQRTPAAPRAVMISRTIVLFAAAFLAAFHTADCRADDAASYPSQTIKIVVPFPAGGTADTLPRIVAERLRQKWNQAVVIENKSGAGGNIGAEAVASSPADGYTLLASPPGPI